MLQKNGSGWGSNLRPGKLVRQKAPTFRYQADDPTCINLPKGKNTFPDKILLSHQVFRRSQCMTCVECKGVESICLQQYYLACNYGLFQKSLAVPRDIQPRIAPVKVERQFQLYMGTENVTCTALQI